MRSQGEAYNDQAGEEVIRRRQARSRRQALKRWQREHTSSPSSRGCWLPSASMVEVGVAGDGIARATGIKRCGSPWACPVCAPTIGEHRARDVDAATAAALERGWGVELVTLTVRHSIGDELAPRLEVIASALGRCYSGAPWKRRVAKWGHECADGKRRISSIRAVEITRGPNGWHAHVHAAVFFGRPITKVERAEFHGWLFERWNGIVEKKGFGSLSLRFGVDVRAVKVVERSGQTLGRYLCKVEGGGGLGLELARSDLKHHGRTPWAILADAASGSEEDAALWAEYEDATRGRRAVVWSPGLRGLLLPESEELSDEEAAADEGASPAEFTVVVPSGVWSVLLLAGRIGDVLTFAERLWHDGRRGSHLFRGLRL